MEVCTVENARSMGFEAQGYSQYPPLGEVLARIDFLAWLGWGEKGLFFRQDGSDVRYYVPLSLGSEAGMDKYASMTFFQYAQRGDLCRLSIAPNGVGGFALAQAEIIKQAPLCVRREQCQPSPCCVFKN